MAKSPQLDTLLDTLLNTLMAKKVTYDNGHICDDCKWCRWHTQEWNRDMDGNPLTYHCSMGQFTSEVRGRKACELWEKSNKITLST